MAKLILAADLQEGQPPLEDEGTEMIHRAQAIEDPAGHTGVVEVPATKLIKSITPGALAAKLAAIETAKLRRRDIRVAQELELARCTQEHGLNFTYVRPFNDETGDYAAHGGATIAWTMPERHGDTFVTVAIAWCRDNEAFSRFAGRAVSAHNFDMEERMKIRLRHRGNFGAQLAEIFAPCVTPKG